jgi:hypothetical protein
MLNWDINNLTLLQEEMLKQAEKDHLADEAVEESRKANPRYNPTLVWFGKQMIDFGSKLVQFSGSEADRDKLDTPDIHLN